MFGTIKLKTEMMRWYAWAGLVLIQLFVVFSAQATHLRAGQITAVRLDCSNTFRITLAVFLDTDGVEFGGNYIYDLGDGTKVTFDRSRLVEVVIDPVLKVSKITYVLDHNYAPGTYFVSYREQFRNADVLNMDNSVGTTFYIESTIVVDPFFGCNSTPILLIDPIDRGCTGAAFMHNPGAYDPDGDSLSYELVVPFQARATEVVNYKNPNDPKFYAGLNYNQANENGDGPPTFKIDPVDGTITWDAPGSAGEYNIAFIVREWRRVGNQVYPMGFVRRDMQIVIADCTNERPRLEIPADTCVVAGTTLNALIKGFDDLGTSPDFHDVKIEVFSEILSLNNNPATYTPNPPVFQSSVPYAQLNFSWDVSCTHVKRLPYLVVFKITDNPPNGQKLVSFETWRITVVPPPPDITSAVADVVAREATIDWQDYACRDEVANVQIQIWRKVDVAPFTPESCDTGMPDFLGYSLIQQVSASQSQYLDKGLAVGASYCYRLVAVFPDGSESPVSNEMCTVPIRADAPVITNVSVDRTNVTDGALTIRWLPPFEIDAGQFPPPYSYVVQRAESAPGGVIGPFQSVVHPNKLDETTLSVSDVGINTENKQYHYRILLYAESVSVNPVDTSAVASTVRLELAPMRESIGLSWSARVPWSNQIESRPYHVIYSGLEGAELNSDLNYKDSINVFVNGQMYTDVGPLDKTTIYCYQVVTRGGYGNPAIPEPLINYSQINCATPKDSIPPCKITVTPVQTNCDEFLSQACDFSLFKNTIFWERSATGCNDNDIVAYKIYYSGSKKGGYQLLAQVADTFYIDINLTSFARCYRIAAVDRSGNEGELSDAVCIENCPYYELPNIFTPNGDEFNNLFSAFNARDIKSSYSDELKADLLRRCARFVQKVRIKMFNRWGKEVYTFESGGEGKTIFIDWDGRDNLGRELGSGVYYYHAEVEFISADPDKSMKQYKGWVHLVR
jgi:hypothetical protein